MLYDAADKVHATVAQSLNSMLQVQLVAMQTIVNNNAIMAAAIQQMLTAAAAPRSVVKDMSGNHVGVTPIHGME